VVVEMKGNVATKIFGEYFEKNASSGYYVIESQYQYACGSISPYV